MTVIAEKRLHLCDVNCSDDASLGVIWLRRKGNYVIVVVIIITISHRFVIITITYCNYYNLQ